LGPTPISLKVFATGNFSQDVTFQGGTNSTRGPNFILVQLAPSEATDIIATVNIPADTADGEYRTRIIFQDLGSQAFNGADVIVSVGPNNFAVLSGLWDVATESIVIPGAYEFAVPWRICLAFLLFLVLPPLLNLVPTQSGILKSSLFMLAVCMTLFASAGTLQTIENIPSDFGMPVAMTVNQQPSMPDFNLEGVIHDLQSVPGAVQAAIAGVMQDIGSTAAMVAGDVGRLWP
jgi:hypothetical protein